MTGTFPPEHHVRKGPLKVTLEFTEFEAPDGLVVYTVIVQNLDGRHHVSHEAVVPAVFASAADPYLVRAQVRARLASKIIYHLHSEASCI